MKKGTRKCFSCSEYYDEYEMSYTLTDKRCCGSCKEQIECTASSCIHINPIMGESVTENFTKEFGSFENYPEMPYPVKEEVYIHTDGWRGYTDWILNDGYVEVSEGWTTGCPESNTSRKALFNEMIEEWMGDPCLAPCELWVICGVTSNVFSTSVTIVALEKDIVKLEAWAKEVDHMLS